MFCINRKPVLAAMLALAAAPAALGQKWEAGAGGGGSFYNARTITSPAGSAEAKFKPGFAASGWLGQLGGRVGGEIRYTFFKNDMELSGPGGKFSMGGRAQAIHYDALIYFNGSSRAKTRGYVLVGGGVKQYTGTGDDVAFQPVGNIAVLTRTSEWKPLVTTGAGVRVALSERMHLRAEVRGYFTQAPKEVITPVRGDLSGWLFDIVPMVSLSYVWE
jgi:hypothetical protein